MPGAGGAQGSQKKVRWRDGGSGKCGNQRSLLVFDMRGVTLVLDLGIYLTIAYAFRGGTSFLFSLDAPPNCGRCQRGQKEARKGN